MTRLSHRLSAAFIVLSMTVILLTIGIHVGVTEAQGIKKFTLINVIFDGTKIWLPSSIIVHEGDEVELTLVNKLDAPHGFQIGVFGIEGVVNPKSKMTVQFTAHTPGLHAFKCHIHPPHIGGQILVLEKK